MIKRAKRILFVSSALGLTCLGASTIALGAGDSHGSIKVYGMKRKYLLHVPKSYSSEKSVPLVIVLHGAFGTAKISRWDSRMSEQSEKDGFIVSYPCAAFGTWNAGRCCGISQHKNVDDVAFISNLIGKLKKDYNIDPSKVYVAGVSNGGMMAYRLGKEISNEIAAIAPIEGCMYESSASPTSPVSVIAFNGTKDPVIPFKGGTGRWLGIKLKVPSVSDAINFWVTHNKCNANPIRESQEKLTVERYTNGQNSTEVCLYTLDGGGHVWYGGRRAVLTGRPQEKEFNVTETMCKFFWEHPKFQKDTATEESRKVIAPQ
jgi:polyhydroxybutyrate depolymerase